MSFLYHDNIVGFVSHISISNLYLFGDIKYLHDNANIKCYQSVLLLCLIGTFTPFKLQNTQQLQGFLVLSYFIDKNY